MKKRWLWTVVGCLMVLILGSAVGYVLITRSNNACDFPTAVRKDAMNLRLYCPDPTKLPSGVQSGVVNASSSVSSGAVVYQLVDGHTTLSVSLQKKPSDVQLANFSKNIIPLNFESDTPLGKGYIGVTPQGQSLLDLPIAHSTTWILITGPRDYSATKMGKIAHSFIAD